MSTSGALTTRGGGGFGPSIGMASLTGDGDSGGNVLMVASWGWNGVTFDRLRTPKVFTNINGTLVSSETTLWTPAAGKKFRLMGGVLASGVAGGAITMRDNTAGATILVLPTTALNAAVPFTLGNGILSAAANNVLTVQGAATETLTGFVYGTEE